MIKNVCIVEDEKYENLLPLVYMRPVYDLRCGILTLKEKIHNSFPDSNLFLHCREYLAEKVSHDNNGIHVNELSDIESCLFVNGRAILNAKTIELISKKGEGVYFSGSTFIAAKISSEKFKMIEPGLNSTFTSSLFEELQKHECDAETIEYPWDLISKNEKEIIADFVFHKSEKKNVRGKVYDGAVIINSNNIFIGEGSLIKPGVVLDAENGPIYIGKNVTIMPNAVIVGPCYVGDNSIIKIGAKIYEKTSIGEFCKVGGEVENSIIHSYANKQHDGFLGHSYISPWCNLGADTNTSDLKNNYSNVKVNLNGKEIDTGSMFVGLIMGDHSKTSINTMFNTGTVCGVSSNIFGSGFPPKSIPSFSWGGAESISEYNLEKALDVASAVAGRRNINFSKIDEELFAAVFDMTCQERK